MSSAERQHDVHPEQAWEASHEDRDVESAIDWRRYYVFFGLCAVVGSISGLVLGLFLI
jgi:hypothetical protein